MRNTTTQKLPRWLKDIAEGFLYAIIITLVCISFLGTTGPVMRYLMV